MKTLSKRTLWLVMILLTVLTISSCSTVKVTPYVEIPELEISVERPVLDAIPELDTTGMTEEQVDGIARVLNAYNLNLGKLVVYSEQLESVIEVQKKYLTQIIGILNEK